jgi:hypothetical protein
MNLSILVTTTPKQPTNGHAKAHMPWTARHHSFSHPFPSNLAQRKVPICLHRCSKSSRLSRRPHCLVLPRYRRLLRCLSFPLISRPNGAMTHPCPLEVQIDPRLGSLCRTGFGPASESPPRLCRLVRPPPEQPADEPQRCNATTDSETVAVLISSNDLPPPLRFLFAVPSTAVLVSPYRDPVPFRVTPSSSTSRAREEGHPARLHV